MKIELMRHTVEPEELLEELVELSYRTQHFPKHPALVEFKSGRQVPLTQLKNLTMIPKPGTVIPGFEKDDVEVVKVIPRTAEKAVRFAIAIGHFALFRQVTVTWRVELSRKSVLHYLRYQHTAENMVSQKYLDQGQFEFIMPTTRDYPPEELMVYKEAMQTIQSYYERLRNFGWDPEDARLVYPNSALQKFIFTANMETMRRLFDILCDEDYVDEMHRFGLAMLATIKKVMPAFVYDYRFYSRNDDGHIYAKRRRRKGGDNVKVNWTDPNWMEEDEKRETDEVCRLQEKIPNELINFANEGQRFFTVVPENEIPEPEHWETE